MLTCCLFFPTAPLSLLDFFTLLLRIIPCLFYLYNSVLSFWTLSSSLLYSLLWSFQQMPGLERHKERLLLRRQDGEKDCRHLIFNILPVTQLFSAMWSGSRENWCLSWPSGTCLSNSSIKHVITKDRLQLRESCMGNIFVNMWVIVAVYEQAKGIAYIYKLLWCDIILKYITFFGTFLGILQVFLIFFILELLLCSLSLSLFC